MEDIPMMKRIMSLILAAVMILSMVPNMEIAAAAQSQQAEPRWTCSHWYEATSYEATCQSYGKTVYTCILCGDTFTAFHSGSYTDWTTEKPVGVPEELIESRTEYRYRTFEYTSSTSSSLDGWVQYDAETQWGDYGPWSGWTGNYIAPSENTMVETQTVWGYYFFRCYNCGAHMHGYGRCYTWAGGCGVPTDDSGWNEVWSTVSWNDANLRDWHGTGKYYTYINGELVFKWNSAGSRTEYRSRTREQYTTYYYWRLTDWSEWGTEPVAENNETSVETRTVYRYFDAQLGEHDYVGVITQPSCTAEGYTTYTCTVCADSYRSDFTEKKEHDFRAVVTPPSCAAQGYTTYICECGESYVDSYVGPLEHQPGNPVEENRVNPECTSEGSYELAVYCTVCNAELSREKISVSPKEHVPGAAVVENEKEASCVQEGSYDSVVYCTECHAELSRETVTVEKNDVHTVVTDKAAAATCEENGLTEGKHCSACGKVLQAQTQIPALGHREIIDQAKEPSCTETGVTEGKHCDVCGKILAAQTVIPALGHSRVIDEAAAPTCTDTGLTEGAHCAVCKQILKAQEPVPALGHRYLVDGNNVTCTVCDVSAVIDLSYEYVTLDLRVCDSIALKVDCSQDDFISSIQWAVEEGGETVVSVDDRGNVKARAVGTAWVTATISGEGTELVARCRVDVTEKPMLDGVQLNTTKLNAELYSNAYAEFEILLRFPQNYPVITNRRSAAEGLAVADAWFTDSAMDELFDLVVVDDRHVKIVPTEYAISNPKEVKGITGNESAVIIGGNSEHVKNTYDSTVMVQVAGETYETEPLHLTVKKTSPKIKATVAPFNSFRSGQRQTLSITGGTVTKIVMESAHDWLMLDGNELVLTEYAPQKNFTTKVTLLVYTQEWRLPVRLSVNVKNTYKAPGLKLASSNVTMTRDPEESAGIALQLLPKNKKDTLPDLQVSGIEAPYGYSVSDFNAETGAFLLKAEQGFRTGKITLNVCFRNTQSRLPLTLTVKTADVKLKLSKSGVTLNTALKETAVVDITATPADYRITEPEIRITDSQGRDRSDELEVRFENGKLYISTPVDAFGTYKVSISACGSKSVTLTVKTVQATPSVTMKVSGQLDISFPEKEARIQTVFKNYSGQVHSCDWSVTEMNGNMVVNPDATHKFLAEYRDNALCVRIREGERLYTGNTYLFHVKLTLEDGTRTLQNTAKLKVKQTPVKLKLSKSKLTLNKLVSDSASVTVSCSTKDYSFTAPVWEVTDKKGTAAPDALNLRYTQGTLTVSLGNGAAFGSTYKVVLRANEFAAPVTLTVTVPTEAKSKITGSLKVSGTLDVIRDGSAVTVTPVYKNMTDCAHMEEQLLIYSSADRYAQPMNHLFDIRRDGSGAFIITKTAGAALDHTRTYKVQLVTVLGGRVVVETKLASLKVKMGAAKLTVGTKDATLFGKDRNDRIDFTLVSKDETLNTAKSVTIKDAKYRDAFEVYDYGSGQFAIGFKDGQVDSKLLGKTVTLTLNVTLDGNESGKINTTVKLKLTVIK